MVVSCDYIYTNEWTLNLVSFKKKKKNEGILLGDACQISS